jgi:hypothetical protein
MAHLFEEVVERGIVSVVDEAECSTSPPIDVLGMSGVDLGQQFVDRSSVSGNLGWRLGHGR